MTDENNAGKESEHASTRRYGWRPSLPDQRDKYLRFGQRHIDALAGIDRYDLTEQVKWPDAYDQGSLGSCTANAIAGILQYQEIKQNVNEPDVMPSRLFIYWNERYLDPYMAVTEDGGSTITMGIRAVKTYGYADENLWPYNVNKFAVQAPSSVYTASVKNRITDYARIPQDLQDMQAAIVAGHPIAFGFSVYQSFESAAVAKSGIVPVPGRRERMVGGHAVVIVGFDNATQRFKVRNSWGPKWGQNGYFTIPYSYLLSRTLAGDFWVINSLPQ